MLSWLLVIIQTIKYPWNSWAKYMTEILKLSVVIIRVTYNSQTLLHVFTVCEVALVWLWHLAVLKGFYTYINYFGFLWLLLENVYFHFHRKRLLVLCEIVMTLKVVGGIKVLSFVALLDTGTHWGTQSLQQVLRAETTVTALETNT